MRLRRPVEDGREGAAGADGRVSAMPPKLCSAQSDWFGGRLVLRGGELGNLSPHFSHSHSHAFTDPYLAVVVRANWLLSALLLRACVLLWRQSEALVMSRSRDSL